MLSIKYVSLLVLAVQNSALILTMRYSRTLSGPKYIPTTAVLLSEVIKTTISLVVLLFSRWKASRSTPATQSLPTPPTTTTRSLLRECFDDILQPSALIAVMVPAILYTIQNNLQYIAATNLNAATFQVLYQGKILTTAFFAVLILRQKLSAIKWTAIFILTAGIVLISYPSATPKPMTRRDASADSRMTGLLAVLAACVLSGFSGVFLEFILKKAKNNHSANGASQLWVRNVQLSAASVIIASLGAAFVDGRQILAYGFFYGYNPVVWATLMLQAVGGLIVAIVITYADNILKGFATSLSLIASTAVSAVIGDVVLTDRFEIGVVLVLAATNIYGISWGAKKSSETEDTSSPLLSQDEESQDGYREADEKALEEQHREEDFGDAHHDEKLRSTPVEQEQIKPVSSNAHIQMLASA